MAPVRSSEIDSAEVIREAMIKRRNKALTDGNMSDAVLFSHAIASLAYEIDLEKENQQLKDQLSRVQNPQPDGY